MQTSQMKRNSHRRLLVSLVLLAMIGLLLSNNRKDITASTSAQNAREVEVKMLPSSSLTKGQLPDVVALAILGSSDFDVTTVDPASIVFAGAAVLVDTKGKYNVSFEDVSYDGITDLVVRLARSDLRVGSAPTKAAFNARTTTGESLSGAECAQASGVPCGGGFVASSAQQLPTGGELASPTAVTFSQNFDGVVAPALPAGWSTSFTNGSGCSAGSNWVTSTTNPSSAPNAAFHNDPNCITDNFLVSPSINIVSTTATLSFKNAFNLESGFDGSVLEVSTDAGATWADITSAAISGPGAFTSGGYNRTISVNFQSPIAGRMAWSGLSGGTAATPTYLNTVANLGANLAGKTVKFRWRCASDSSVSATGQWIDDISVNDTIASTCTLTCPANVTKSNDPNQCGAVVNYPAPTSTGTCGTITCTPASGSFFPVGTTTVTCQAAATGAQGTNPPVTEASGTIPSGQNNNGNRVTVPGGPQAQVTLPSKPQIYFPQTVFALLYDQTDSASAAATSSQNFEAAFNAFDDAAADDFVVPAGVVWQVNQVNAVGLYFNGAGPANSFNVTFYPDVATLPGSAEATYTNLAYVNTAGNFQIALPVAAILPSGTHWVSVQANMDFGVGGQFGWTDRTVTSNSGAAWINPGGGFGAGCSPNWGRKTSCVAGSAPDNLFQILGTSAPVGGGGPTCMFTVTVNDTQPPSITCPASIFVAAAASCPIATTRTVNFSVTASDNCPGVTVVCSPASGSIFPVGTTSVTCTATDASGNTATCSFTVDVFSACLVDESNPGNVVLFNAQTGEYRFCCNGQLLASGTGTLTLRGCIGSISELKGTRKVTIEFDTTAFSGVGRGTASLFLNGSSTPKCQILDQNMRNDTCLCGSAPPPTGPST